MHATISPDACSIAKLLKANVQLPTRKLYIGKRNQLLFQSSIRCRSIGYRRNVITWRALAKERNGKFDLCEKQDY
jgi:hypothetical protein